MSPVPIERQRRRPLRVELIPMIDVVFFLLVFFMVFSTFKTTPEGLDIQLPRAASAHDQTPTELVVSVDRYGSIYLASNGGTPNQVNLDQLRQAVRAAVERNPDVLVAVNGDRATAYDHIVAVIDAASQAGARRVGLAVERPQNEPA